MSDHDAIRALEAEFAGWMIFRAVNYLCYARCHDAPDKILRGEDWTDLRNELRRQQ